MKRPATFTVEADDWQQFRLACMERKTTASDLIGKFIAQQLASWRKKDTQQQSVQRTQEPKHD